MNEHSQTISDEDVPAFLKKGQGREPKEPAVVSEPEKQDAPMNVQTATPELPFPPVMKSPMLDRMTVEELRRQQEDIDRRIQAKQEAEKKAIIEQIVEIVQTYKIPVDELVEGLGGLKIKRKGVKAKIKYRDPSSGATWSGRGKEPLWIKGLDRTPFSI